MNKLNNMPIVPLRAMVIFPNTSVSVDMGRKITIDALDNAVSNKSRVVAVMQKDSNIDDVSAKDLHTVGTLCDVSKVVRLDENTIRVYLDGLTIVDVGEYNDNAKFLSASVYERETSPDLDKKELDVYKSYVLSTYQKLSNDADRNYPPHIRKAIEECESAELLVNLGSGLISPMFNKYELFITESPHARLDMLCELLGEDLAYAKKIHEIEYKVQSKLSKNNRDYVLREQIKAMQDEIGDGEDDAIREYKEKIEKLDAPSEVKEKLNKEVTRLARMTDAAPEASIIRSYLDIALSLPWGKSTEDKRDLKAVRAILDEDHYGIDDVKDRIVEYLAVRELSQSKAKGTAICLSGPPGVGKTSIARSIARALGKEYIQLTLGGVHDEAEIRGHRKTYIGAMPGRIISSLVKAKTNNPVFLLDEVDKITRDMRGDPQSALLEVLDPNQNKEFRDNYLELPYDLSNVMFILTANDLSSLDKPLLDRLEVIHMDGYTTDEKIAIADKYLVKKQSIEHGLGENRLSMSANTLREIIEGYTNESGVRELERKIATVARKVAYRIVNDGVTRKQFAIKSNELNGYLGVRQNGDIEKVSVGEIGRVTGLAWTALGGVTLNIEAMVVDGTGELKLTGSLGDVMKESAYTALTIVRSMVAEKGYGAEYFKTHDIHIHVPMGGVPKDGPSAGVTMTTAIYSAITKAVVADKVAMTGEISLSGRVLPIGGLKEKALAAHRVGIKTIIIPKDNERDLEKLPSVVMKDIEFVKVERIGEVLALAVAL